MTSTASIAQTSSVRQDLRVILLVSAAHFVSHYFILLLPPYVLLIRAEHEVTFTQIGIALMVFNLTSMVFQTPAGYLVDRVSPCDLLIGGLVLGAASDAVAGLVCRSLGCRC